MSTKRKVQSGKAGSVAETNPPVPIRHMDFGFSPDTMQRYCFDDNAFASTFFMAFSSVIPHGERFFIQSVRRYRDQITDPELQARVTGFIGQEAMHGKEHDAVNDAYTALGFPVRTLDKFSKHGLRLLSRVLPKSVQLAFTAGLEHHTAIISEYTLRRPDFQQKFDESGRGFILWHMMEETEHKAVAYDVYQKTVGSYAIRVGTMIPSTALLIGVLAGMQMILLASDRSFIKKGNWRGVADIYGPKGLFFGVLPTFLDYFRPDFHPNQHDTEALLKEVRERFFGTEGELLPQLQKTVVPRVKAVAAV